MKVHDLWRPKTLWWMYFMRPKRMKSHRMSLTKNVLKETRVIYICWAEARSSSLVITNAYVLVQMHSTVAPLTKPMPIMCYLHCRICWSNCGPTKYGWTDFQKQSLICLWSRPFSSVATHGFVMLLMNTENNVQCHFSEYQSESQQIKHLYHTIIWQVM